MSKKILSVVLALTMVLSLFAISASAIGAAGYEELDDNGISTYTQSWGLGEPVDNEDGTWSVDVTLAANYVVGGIQFQVANTNNKGVVLVEFVPNDEVFTDDYGAKTFVFNDTGIVTIIPSPLAEGSEGIDLTAGAVLGQLVYEVAEGASADINIVNDGKSATNPGGNLIAARLSDGNLSTATSITGQTVLAVGETKTIGAAMVPADLAKKASAEAGILIDKTHKFGDAYSGVVFGFTQAANNTFMNTTYLNNAFEATNGGSLAFSRSIGATGYGTGTVITVKNADGTEAAKYVVVIFGDVDGNGLINGNDTKACQAAAKINTSYDKLIQRMAANCQNVAAAAMMYNINGNDTKVIQAHTKGTKIDQAALATKMASLTTTHYK